jgi:hypothetical protein
MQAEMADALQDLDERWAEKADQVEELRLTPARKDVLRDAFGLAWVPHWVGEGPGGPLELPGFAAQ